MKLCPWWHLLNGQS